MYNHNQISNTYAIAYTSMSRRLFFNVPQEEVMPLMASGDVVIVEQHPQVPHITHYKLRKKIQEKVGNVPVALKFNPFGEHEWVRTGSH